MKIPVSIIIANYNGSKYLRECLDSLLKTTFHGFEIIIVDDGSEDESLKIIKSYSKKFKNFHLLTNDKNLGAAASRNIALPHVKGKVVVFLDNDTEVEPQTIKTLVDPILKNKGVGATQAVLVDFSDRTHIQMAGGELIRSCFWLAPFYQRSSFMKVRKNLSPRKIISISACMAVRKEVLDKIGGFDSMLAVYTEDLDFSLRIWIAGYEILLAHDSLCYHWTKQVSQRQDMNAHLRHIYFNLVKNSFVSITKNYELINVLRYLPVSISINFVRGVYLAIRSGDLSAFISFLQALIWFIVNIRSIIRNRKMVQMTRKISDKQLFDQVFSQESLPSLYRKYFT